MFRRYKRKSQNQKTRAIGYSIMGIAMVLYAIPKLPLLSFSTAGLFSLVWLLFALLVIGSNLYYLIGVDREARQEAGLQEIQVADQHHRKLLMRD